MINQLADITKKLISFAPFIVVSALAGAVVGYIGFRVSLNELPAVVTVPIAVVFGVSRLVLLFGHPRISESGSRHHASRLNLIAFPLFVSLCVSLVFMTSALIYRAIGLYDPSTTALTIGVISALFGTAWCGLYLLISLRNHMHAEDWLQFVQIRLNAVFQMMGYYAWKLMEVPCHLANV